MTNYIILYVLFRKAGLGPDLIETVNLCQRFIIFVVPGRS